jgi:2Fe-2S ferredoxin
MFSKTATIEFVYMHQGTKYCLQSYEKEYRNLMVLLKDKIGLEDFGQCGGMGRCGSCLVNVPGLAKNRSPDISNEQNTLSKMGISNPAIRLSCHIEITKELQNVTVYIPDDIY